MRDHVDHDFSMVGCSWGTKLLDENIRSQWKMAWKKGQDDSIMYSNRNLWGPDQNERGQDFEEFIGRNHLHVLIDGKKPTY